MMDKSVNDIKIHPEASIKESLKKINKTGLAILFVCDDDGRLVGTLTDGDIRRKVLRTGSLQGEIKDCYNSRPAFVMENGYTDDDVKSLMLKKTLDVIPVINNQKQIVKVLFWKNVFERDPVFRKEHKEVDVPVVIMAGGKGERMGPFTKILPKPLIPIGEKPVIEVIIDRFNHCGVKHFYITLNYKGEMVKAYFESMETKYEISYVWEKEFHGTGGSLGLLPEGLGDTFIVSNCDIIVDTNYRDLVDFHREHENILTVVGSIQHHKIPYGVIQFEKGGKVNGIREKPELDFTVNTGLYVLSQKAMNYIPRNEYFDMTDLLQTLLDENEPVGVYPVPQNSYVDIGQWEEYKKVMEKLQV